VRRIDTEYLGAGRRDLRRELAGPATEIDDSLTGARLKQFDEIGAQLPDGLIRAIVARRIPGKRSGVIPRAMRAPLSVGLAWAITKWPARDTLAES